MWYDIIKDILSSEIGSATFVFTLVAGCMWVVWHVAQVTATWKLKQEEIGKLNDKVVALDTGVLRVEEKVRHANCSNNTESIRELKADIKDMNVEVTDIRVAMARGAEGRFGRKKSPKVLTELGERIFAEIEGSEFLKANKDTLFAKLDKEQPKTALDVQMMSYWACISISKEDVFNKIKSYIYNCPELDMENSEGQIEKHELTLSDVCSILSLPLRDMYLDAHPEIEV